LKRITGLSLHIELPETENAAEHDDEEFLSYTLHQLDALIDSYKETNSREAIYKRWITGEMETHELIHTAKRFHVPLPDWRALFLVESKDTMENSVITILKHACPDVSRTWFIPTSSCQLAIVYTFSEEISVDTLHSSPYLVMDLLN